ncbi:rRNA 2'-O-methyltransferase fibrillarin-like [Perca fluviatilis]|uniref:rRNA 2'-O-methyltransferase fibrillarin-like n=1 Tax=Perca fluviatilis TaxID=8168 RepID=UPI0019658C37|nr:rRNA 2'-O-methyltransferase fibrillarin-like [Perca fluviatilis]
MRTEEWIRGGMEWRTETWRGRMERGGGMRMGRWEEWRMSGGVDNIGGGGMEGRNGNGWNEEEGMRREVEGVEGMEEWRNGGGGRKSRGMEGGKEWRMEGGHKGGGECGMRNGMEEWRGEWRIMEVEGGVEGGMEENGGWKEGGMEWEGKEE